MRTLLLGLALSCAGCRADVDGFWQGSLGAWEASLELQQVGAALTGTLCVGDDCAPVDGSIVDHRVELYRDQTCLVCITRLDLELRRGRLAGRAYDESCPPEVTCGPFDAAFRRD